ncbi:MAG: exopolyphosphatase, partial [Gammaproteobacteria bacterium]
PRDEGRDLRRSAVLLRLAALLNRSRSEGPLPELRVDGRHLHLRFAGNWLDANPLTRADLEQEAQALRTAKVLLSFE